MYPPQTSLIILGMVLMGTARSVGVKIFYQLNDDDNNPLFIALLYLLGQSMALLVYGVSKYFSLQNCGGEEEEEEQEYARVNMKEMEGGIFTELATEEQGGCEDEPSQITKAQQHTDEEEHPFHRCQSAPITNPPTDDTSSSSQIIEEFEMSPLKHSQSLPLPLPLPPLTLLKRRGSKTGLTQESQEAVAWVHSIPWQLKPLIPGLFNLANSALKWASYVFVAASIAEMLMGGLELVLSVVVARVVRKRQINSMRWTGVIVVAVGLATVHAAADVLWDSTSTTKNNDETVEEDGDGESRHSRDHWMGVALIVGQCVTAVGQDMAEELFLQESNFPATLLLGMEGVFGLIFGIPLYLYFAPETPLETLATLQESEWKMMYLSILVLIFTVTGIFNIMTTGVTSSMTRNMWKNCRTLLVWMVGLVIFYSLGDDNLGEEWIVPDSFFILGGFLIMLSGIYIYYKNK